MVCSAISSYSFGATALIFCRMFIHIMQGSQNVTATGDFAGYFWLKMLTHREFFTWKVNISSFYAPATKSRGEGILIYPCPFVCPDIDTWFVRLSPPTVLELQL